MRTVEHFYERAKAKRLHPERALKKEALNYLFLFKIWARRRTPPEEIDNLRGKEGKNPLGEKPSPKFLH